MKNSIFFYLLLLMIITFSFTPLTFSKYETYASKTQNATVAKVAVDITNISASTVILDIASSDATYDLSFKLNNYITQNNNTRISEVDLSYTVEMETSIPYPLLYNGAIDVEASLSPDFNSNIANIRWLSNGSNGTIATLIFNPALTSNAGVPYSKTIYIRFRAKKSAFSLNQNYSIINLRATYEQID